MATQHGFSKLTTLDRLKARLGVCTADDDAYYTAMIDVASQAIEDYCERTFGQPAQDLEQQELFSLHQTDMANRVIMLDQYPVQTFTSLAWIDMNVAAPTPTLFNANEYALDARAGIIRWTRSGLAALNSASASSEEGTLVLTATYTGGYTLPGTDGFTLPPVIEQTCIDMVKDRQSLRDRPLGLRQEQIPDVYQVSYFSGGAVSDQVDMVLAGVDPYRDVRI